MSYHFPAPGNCKSIPAIGDVRVQSVQGVRDEQKIPRLSYHHQHFLQYLLEIPARILGCFFYSPNVQTEFESYSHDTLVDLGLWVYLLYTLHFPTYRLRDNTYVWELISCSCSDMSLAEEGEGKRGSRAWGKNTGLEIVRPGAGPALPPNQHLDHSLKNYLFNKWVNVTWPRISHLNPTFSPEAD